VYINRVAYGFWKRDVSIVKGRDGERYITSQNEYRKRHYQAKNREPRVSHFASVCGIPSYSLGNSPLYANVITRVVINVLSAAGSRMVPKTERILNLRAMYPSNYQAQSTKSTAQPLIEQVNAEMP
jgi:hypothetical protein